MLNLAIVLHETFDDMSNTSATGNAGGRLGCCKILEEDEDNGGGETDSAVRFDATGFLVMITSAVIVAKMGWKGHRRMSGLNIQINWDISTLVFL